MDVESSRSKGQSSHPSQGRIFQVPLQSLGLITCLRWIHLPFTHLFIHLLINKFYSFIYICLFNFLFIHLCIHTRFTYVFHMHSTYHFHEVYIYYKLTSGITNLQVVCMLSRGLYRLNSITHFKVPGLNLGEAWTEFLKLWSIVYLSFTWIISSVRMF